jgi:hypothetical protein
MRPSLQQLQEWHGLLSRLSGEIEESHGELPRDTHPPKLESLVRFAAEEAPSRVLIALAESQVEELRA